MELQVFERHGCKRETLQGSQKPYAVAMPNDLFAEVAWLVPELGGEFYALVQFVELLR